MNRVPGKIELSPMGVRKAVGGAGCGTGLGKIRSSVLDVLVWDVCYCARSSGADK